MKLDTKYIRKGNDQKGFTMLEMLVAVTFIAVGLLAAASMQGVAFRSNSVANKVTVANMLAQQVMEDIHSRSVSDPIYTNALGVTNQAYVLDAVNSSTTLTIPGAGKYTANYSITPNAVINGASVAGTSQIDVSVAYLGSFITQTVTTRTSYKTVL